MHRLIQMVHADAKGSAGFRLRRVNHSFASVHQLRLCISAPPRSHREERSDAAIQDFPPDGANPQTAALDCFVAALLAMTSREMVHAGANGSVGFRKRMVNHLFAAVPS